MNWTDERRQKALQLFNEGHSAAAIAHVLGDGATRNSVLGIVDRARRRGETVRGGQPAQGRVFVLETPKTRTQPKPPRPMLRDMTAPAARLKDDGSRIDTMDLRQNDCRWPHGDVGAADFHYCAQAKEAGSPYCRYHAARAATPRNAA